MTTYSELAHQELVCPDDTLAQDIPSGLPEQQTSERGGRAPQLRHLLVFLDFSAAAVGWRAAQLIDHGNQVASTSAEILLVLVLAGASVAMAGASQLYRARVCSLRSVEIQRTARVALAANVLAVLIGPRIGANTSLPFAAVGALISFLLAVTLRGAFRSWLQAQRKAGRFLRRVVLVGADAEGRRVLRLVDGHPEAGYAIVGVVGGTQAGATELGYEHLGQLEGVVEAVRRVDANGVIIAMTAWTSAELNGLVRHLLDAGLHIHLSTGVQGIAQGRLRPLPLAYEPLFYVESTDLSPWRLALKRLLDLTVASTTLVACLPVLALAALAIKLQDGGPVLFRQRRVGLGGEQFTMLKLRTMSADAESRYAELATSQAGRTGPLVKLTHDPRITRVGRFLRASSIDELPQLLNVLGGSMSIVGPRPNLLVEAAELDPLFLAQKATVRPGITGLWQVEARDNPSFEEYRRYDVFYLENWSVGLDAAIMLATVARVFSRTLRLCVRLPSSRSGSGAIAPPALE